MSRTTSKAIDPSRSRGSEIDLRRMSTPMIPTNFNYMDATPSAPPPRVLSPPPTPRSPPPRPDRLSLRLRSNSGLRMHTNDAALSQYTDYQSSGQHSPRKATFFNSIEEHVSQNIDHVMSPRSTRPSSRASMTWGGGSAGLNSALPFMDLLGKDAFQMATENSSIVRHLIRYCEDHGSAENVDFLMKIREYNAALNDMTSVLTSISTKYTSIGASSPLNLPPMVSRPLNADIKRIAHSIIPSLENVFFESRSHIEGELAQDVFPGFVKRQLVHCTAAELASDTAGESSHLEYPGLGTSFCMTDAQDPKNSLVTASEDFEELTGYSLEDVVGRNCALLQGPFSDPEAVRRIQIAMRDHRECVELILNHHKNGEPFWNLLFLIPLKDADGCLQHWLGAQINVSECMNSRKDLLRVLNAGQPLSLDNESVDGSTIQSDKSVGRDAPKESRPRKNSMISGRRNSKDASAARNWFSTFSRKATTPAPCPPSPPPMAEGLDSASMTGSKKSRTSQFSSQRFASRLKAPAYPTAYSYYMVLRCVNGGGSASQRQVTPGAKKKHSSKLMVSFYSDAVLELLSLPSDIAQADIFQLLSERAHSPSITKGFKASVREAIDLGETTSLELLLEKGRKRRASTGTGHQRPSAFDLQLNRGDDRDDKKFAKHSKHERLWSHWTALRDAKGQVDWVVLIISPTS